ncbi:unnamed protein product (macronuclear) [Paramecium tetraurelia]|uniref:MORN repeat protein n=1 Tax=Paramecium tetraurelia TaxID=5888 RepID=A0CUB8_PARTE|nr:uncharacterized protein GSPATT00010585001 [Paramecium tetraurelia]CAK74385.1 unnamed protein product [Paramecium tetraurelia]|eukprot:XP_001441782.1 hypothetical protein (macronuclear) [Paramecium tetraurelia strain d4-2]
MFKHKKSPSLLDTTRQSIEKYSLLTSDVSTIKKPQISPINFKKIRTPSTLVEPLQKTSRQLSQQISSGALNEILTINQKIAALQQRKSVLLQQFQRIEYSDARKSIRYNKDFNNKYFDKQSITQMEKNWTHYQGQMDQQYKFNGKGVLYFKNAKVFGVFKDGNLEGRATIFDSEFKISVGQYKQGILQQIEYH